QDGVVRRDRARHSGFWYRDLGLDAPRTGEAGRAVHAGDRLERGDGSQYGLVGTGCHLPCWIATGLLRWSPLAALEATTQPAPCHRRPGASRRDLAVYLPC